MAKGALAKKLLDSYHLAMLLQPKIKYLRKGLSFPMFRWPLCYHCAVVKFLPSTPRQHQHKAPRDDYKERRLAYACRFPPCHVLCKHMIANFLYSLSTLRRFHGQPLKYRWQQGNGTDTSFSQSAQAPHSPLPFQWLTTPPWLCNTHVKRSINAQCHAPCYHCILSLSICRLEGSNPLPHFQKCYARQGEESLYQEVRLVPREAYAQ